MNALIAVLAAAILGGIGFVVFKVSKLQPSDSAEDVKLRAEYERVQEKVGELTEKIRAAQSERDELSGKNKLMFASLTKLEEQMKSLSRERDALSKEVAQYEAAEKKREDQANVRIQQLEAAKQALDDTRARIQREDEERLHVEAEERDRVWNDHELSVIAQLKELCRKPEYNFPCFDNNNLPASFDGSLKPDFLIEFLGQYVIFDAKVSKAKSLQTYITDAVKKTVEKIKGNDKIARFLYLVVPASAIAELKGRTVYVNDKYTIYIISPDALAPVLASLKEITKYEFAEQMDPQERENIISLIAKFDWHISMRNGFDILMAKQGADIVGDVRSLAPDLVADILDRKDKLGVTIPNKSELKRLLDPGARLQEISEMESPRPKVAKKLIEQAKAALFE